MYCSKCGNKLSEVDGFCSKCGEKINTGTGANISSVTNPCTSLNKQKFYIWCGVSGALLGLYALLLVLPAVTMKQTVPQWYYLDMDEPRLPWKVFDLLKLIFQNLGPGGAPLLRCAMIVAVIAAGLLVLSIIYSVYCLITYRNHPGYEMESSLKGASILALIVCIAILVVNASINAMSKGSRSALGVTEGFHVWICLIAALINLILVIPQLTAAKKRFHFGEQDNPTLGNSMDKKASGGTWTCPECGRINAHYVGSCACGGKKP